MKRKGQVSGVLDQREMVRFEQVVWIGQVDRQREFLDGCRLEQSELVGFVGAYQVKALVGFDFLSFGEWLAGGSRNWHVDS